MHSCRCIGDDTFRIARVIAGVVIEVVDTMKRVASL